MKDYVLASVGDVTILHPTTGDFIMQGKALTDSNVNFSATEQEVRGGFLNALITSYFTDSTLSFELNNATFNMQSIALNTGSSIEVGGGVTATESVTIAQEGQLVVTDTPQDFSGLGTIGWATKSGEDDWEKVTFVGKTAVVADAQVGDVYCVKYIKEDMSAEIITVSSAFVPAQCKAILTLPLFRTGTSGGSGDKAKAGYVEIEVPLAQFLGNMALSLSSTGNATTPLSFKALKSNDGVTSCDGTSEGMYARVKQVVAGTDPYADIKSIVIADSDIALSVNETETIEVYAIYKGGNKAPRKIDPSELTMTATPSSVVQIASDGTITAKGNGDGHIEVHITNKTNLSATAVVTVG